jgi:hypothetical protein
VALRRIGIVSLAFALLLPVSSVVQISDVTNGLVN